MSIVVIFRSLQWIFNFLKHLFLGNKPFSYYLKARRSVSIMFLSIIVLIAALIVLGRITNELRASLADAQKQLSVCLLRGQDKSPPTKSVEVNGAPPDDEYNSEEHAKFVQDYFNDLLKSESTKDRH